MFQLIVGCVVFYVRGLTAGSALYLGLYWKSTVSDKNMFLGEVHHYSTEGHR